jgi:hypothetical protein
MGNLDARKSCGGKLGRVSFVQRPFQGIRENGRKNYMSFKHIMMVWNTHLTWQPWSRSFHFGLQFRIWGVHSETRLVLAAPAQFARCSWKLSYFDPCSELWIQVPSVLEMPSLSERYPRDEMLRYTQSKTHGSSRSAQTCAMKHELPKSWAQIAATVLSEFHVKFWMEPPILLHQSALLRNSMQLCIHHRWRELWNGNAADLKPSRDLVCRPFDRKKNRQSSADDKRFSRSSKFVF